LNDFSCLGLTEDAMAFHQVLKSLLICFNNILDFLINVGDIGSIINEKEFIAKEIWLEQLKIGSFEIEYLEAINSSFEEIKILIFIIYPVLIYRINEVQTFI
jgi:hypothetical protein